jgi:hypothetical protein
MRKPKANRIRNVLRWAAMLLTVAAVGSLALPGFFSLTLKLLAAALGAMVLWFVFPGGSRNDE